MPSEVWWSGFGTACVIWVLFVVSICVIGAAIQSSHEKDEKERKLLEEKK